jgi:hypothetical protein
MCSDLKLFFSFNQFAVVLSELDVLVDAFFSF